MGQPRRPGLRALADLATPMAVRVAATLRVADHVVAGYRTAGQIAAAAGVRPGELDRVLRHLVTVGLFSRDETGAYGLTEDGEQLRDDHPGGRRKWLDNGGAVGRGDLAFVELERVVRTGEPAYPVRYGVPFWDDLAQDPPLSASFDALMGHHVTLDTEGVADAYDWAALGHVTDVGGGTGSLLAALLARHPDLRGRLFDQDGPAGRARAHLAERGLAGRTEVVAGSFFEPLPVGSGGYVLSAILHDWDDPEAVAILRRCAEAAGPDGRVLVIEAIGGDGESVGTAMDLRMLVYTGGRERGLGELSELAAKAGLAVRAVHPVGAKAITSVIELVAG